MLFFSYLCCDPIVIIMLLLLLLEMTPLDTLLARVIFTSSAFAFSIRLLFTGAIFREPSERLHDFGMLL